VKEEGKSEHSKHESPEEKKVEPASHEKKSEPKKQVAIHEEQEEHHDEAPIDVGDVSIRNLRFLWIGLNSLYFPWMITPKEAKDATRIRFGSILGGKFYFDSEKDVKNLVRHFFGITSSARLAAPKGETRI